MNIISFNILFKDNRKIILTETPYLFVNENLKSIINEIRNIIRNDFIDISQEMKLPVTKLSLGMTTYSTYSQNTHFFEIDAYNIKDLQDILLNL